MELPLLCPFVNCVQAQGANYQLPTAEVVVSFQNFYVTQLICSV
ncbi:hypothetical protein COLO4_22699 [Corchorus olitorius]|uniref:Uncharacterized protein n=1 Tax=Corchorus olitorius TaxID=93759 RepID=A0A1R3IKG9_9ROSI|nr:hypothetical protein COLO4_22699 [Corchorus olitorius]